MCPGLLGLFTPVCTKDLHGPRQIVKSFASISFLFVIISSKKELGHQIGWTDLTFMLAFRLVIYYDAE